MLCQALSWGARILGRLSDLHSTLLIASTDLGHREAHSEGGEEGKRLPQPPEQPRTAVKYREVPGCEFWSYVCAAQTEGANSSSMSNTDQLPSPKSAIHLANLLPCSMLWHPCPRGRKGFVWITEFAYHPFRTSKQELTANHSHIQE